MDLKEKAVTDQNKHARHPWEQARVEVVISLLKKNVPYLFNRKVTILDMGCGDTFVAEQLSIKIPQSTILAVDIAFTDEMIGAYREKYKEEGKQIEVYKTAEDAFQRHSSAVDVVLLLDVIEHIEDDIGFMRYIRGIPGIDRDTFFLITVPAYQRLFCAHDVFLEHYRRYTNASLERHIKDAGYTSLKKGYFFSSLLFPRFIQVLLEKIKNPSTITGVGAWDGGSTKSGFIRNLLIFDFKLSFIFRKIGIKLPGLSNYLICKKSA